MPGAGVPAAASAWSRRSGSYRRLHHPMRTSATTTCPGGVRQRSGAVGKVDIYNVARPGDVKHMPAKFSGLRVAAGDVRILRPCGGGFGDPLERPAEKVLDDVLDGFHRRACPRRLWRRSRSGCRDGGRGGDRGASRTYAISAAAPGRRGRGAARNAATARPAGLRGCPDRPARSARRHARGRRQPAIAARGEHPLAEVLRGLRKPTATLRASRSCATAPTATRSRSSGSCAPMARPCVKARRRRAARALARRAAGARGE